MPVESAADRASFFSTSEFAELALFTPSGGSGSVCTIIYDRGQGQNRMEVGESGATGAERSAWINADDVASVQRGARIVVPVDEYGDAMPGAETLEVIGKPKLDDTGFLWAVDLVLVD
ncbi:hypothetical protein NUH86_01735 [Sphingobium sp. JS3065]|uniref:head-tail joining protein n=1 Tax=Sphingobium sp. JS3065 TaxID=2970925 RepID=UPI002265061E|nr:hypothetical protein [Sphingobium sp. JS3065]UZW55552.1 hypothetical protein NUH86_01735 [Sphingobium sp. JS3065]